MGQGEISQSDAFWCVFRKSKENIMNLIIDIVYIRDLVDRIEYALNTGRVSYAQSLVSKLKLTAEELYKEFVNKEQKEEP